MEQNQLEEILKIAVKYGVTELHLPEMQVKLQPSKVSQSDLPVLTSSNTGGLTPDKAELTGEDLLFYSSGT